MFLLTEIGPSWPILVGSIIYLFLSKYEEMSAAALSAAAP